MRHHCDDRARKHRVRPSSARPERPVFRAFHGAAVARGVRRRVILAPERRQKPRISAGFGAATACHRARPPEPADFRAFGGATAGGTGHASHRAAPRRQKPQNSAGFGGATAYRCRKTAQKRRDGRERRERRAGRGNGGRVRHGGVRLRQADGARRRVSPAAVRHDPLKATAVPTHRRLRVAARPGFAGTQYLPFIPFHHVSLIPIFMDGRR
jgi:hypothetical protein